MFLREVSDGTMPGTYAAFSGYLSCLSQESLGLQVIFQSISEGF
jgi:hypothetical protein